MLESEESGLENMKPRPSEASRRPSIYWARLGTSTAIEKVRDQIESRAKAFEYRELNLRALRGRDDLLAKSIFRCTAADPCAEILCPAVCPSISLMAYIQVLALSLNPLSSRPSFWNPLKAPG